MIVSNAPPLFSGASKQALLLKNALIDIGDIDIEVLSVDQKEVSPIHNIGITRVIKSDGIMQYSINIIKYFIKNQFDIIHFHGIYYWQIIALLYPFYKNKMIFKITMMGQDDLNSIAKMRFGKLRIRMLKHVKAIVVLTDEFVSNDFNNIHLVPNGVEITKYYPAKNSEKNSLKNKYHIEKSVPCIIYSGVICERKNQLELLKKLKGMLLSKKISVVFCGSYVDNYGEYDHNYVISVLEYAKQFSHVHVFGHSNDLQEYYRACDFIISNSTGEGLSNSILEGVCCGLTPIIIDQKSQTLPIAIKSIALMIDPSLSSDSIYYEIKNVMDNPMSEETTVNLRNEFSIEHTAYQIMNVYAG
jgi:glycosyltransferase involved in cell wall biosynthesis